jgi:hypothetical protein
MTIIRGVPLLVALVAWNASAAWAQNTPCDASQFDALTNMWKLEPDQNTREIPAGELAAERKVMQRVVEMFKSAFVPTGAAGYYGVNYDILPQAVLNKSRYGNTYIFSLSNHRIECRNDKPVALDVSLGNVSVQRLLAEATDDAAFVRHAQVPGLTESGYVFTTLEDRANRIYVTVNPDYYNRSLPKSAPQHILIRLERADVAFLNRTGNGARHLESIEKLREIVRANLPEFRSMVK